MSSKRLKQEIRYELKDEIQDLMTEYGFKSYMLKEISEVEKGVKKAITLAKLGEVNTFLIDLRSIKEKIMRCY